MIVVVVASAPPPKRTKLGDIKRTKGADKRQGYSAAFSLAAIEAHDGAVARGCQTRDGNGHATGTRVPFHTLWRWKRPAVYATLVQRAAREVRNELTIQRSPYQMTDTMVSLHHYFDKRLRKMRQNKRKITTDVALHEGIRIWQVLAQDGGATWPVVRKSGR